MGIERRTAEQDGAGNVTDIRQGRPIERGLREDLSPREERQARRAEADAAATWSAWASDIATRVTAMEARLKLFVGDPADPNGNSVLVGLVSEIERNAESARAEGLARLAAAWTDRLEAEIGVLDERLSERVDGKIFDLGALRTFKAKLEKMAGDLQTEVIESLRAGDAKIAELGDRFVALSKKRDLHALSVRLALLERALPKPTPSIVSWKVDCENYTVAPMMSDGRQGAALNLFPILERLAADLADTRR